MTDPRHRLGLRAEGATAAWLERRGWRVVARRWRAASGEVDLVCLDPTRFLVGVEVRARRTVRAGSALESVDARHIARVRLALAAFADASPLPHRGLRVDLVAVRPAHPDAWHFEHHRAVDAW